MVRQALAGAGVTSAAGLTRSERLKGYYRAHPLRLGMLAAAVLLLVVGGILLLRPARLPLPTPQKVSRPAPPVVEPSPARPTEVMAARLTQAHLVLVAGRPARAGAALRAGWAVEVSPRGLAEVVLERGGHLRVFPRTSLTLAARGEIVDLTRGKVWCEVEGGRGTFRVRTAEGEARVIGTSFVVERAAGRTEVRVMRGAVEVEDARQRGRLRLRGRQRTRLAAGRPPEPPRHYAPSSDSDSWRRLHTAILRVVKDAKRVIKRTFRSIRNKLR